MIKNSSGGASMMMLILTSLALASGGIYLIKTSDKDLKISGRELKKSSDENLLTAYLSKKIVMVKNGDATLICGSEQPPETVGTIDYVYSCKDIGAGEMASSDVDGRIISAQLIRNGKRSKKKTIFIPTIPYIGKTVLQHGTGVTRATNSSIPTLPIPLSAGSKVYNEDLIKTDSDSYAKYRMIDQTHLFLGESSEFKFLRAHYPNNVEDRDYLFELIKGTLRSNVLVRSTIPTVKIKVRTVALAVRGTEYWVTKHSTCENDSIICPIEVGVIEGSVAVIFMGGTTNEKMSDQWAGLVEWTDYIMVNAGERFSFAEVYVPETGMMNYYYKETVHGTHTAKAISTDPAGYNPSLGGSDPDSSAFQTVGLNIDSIHSDFEGSDVDQDDIVGATCAGKNGWEKGPSYKAEKYAGVIPVLQEIIDANPPTDPGKECNWDFTKNQPCASGETNCDCTDSCGKHPNGCPNHNAGECGYNSDTGVQCPSGYTNCNCTGPCTDSVGSCTKSCRDWTRADKCHSAGYATCCKRYSQYDCPALGTPFAYSACINSGSTVGTGRCNGPGGCD